MTTDTHNGRWTHRLGQGVGRAWRGYLRREQRVVGLLVGRGVPPNVAKVVPWVIKLVVLGALLYAAFWLVLLLVFAIVAVWGVRNTDWDDEEENRPEWRDGHSGFGLYDKNEWRHDAGGPDE